MLTDPTHDPALRSWVDATDTDFPIQNLPYGVFRRGGKGEGGGRGNETPRIGIAIGHAILDLNACVEARLLDDVGSEGASALSAATLNPFLGLGRQAWGAARRAISGLLREDNATLRDDTALRDRVMLEQREAEMLVPATIGDYTDFYCSIHHAMNVGSMFRPDNPLLPNYKHLPVGYHGRASSLLVSGTPIRRPMGQTVAGDSTTPSFGPCRLLDYELEMAFFTGPGNELGERIAIADAGDHIFGLCILNDWSARDIQKWEYQPLGPFNAKNFASTISPWVVTLEALAPFRVAGSERAQDDPPVLEYLKPSDDFGLDITAEVFICSSSMRERGIAPFQISRGSFRDMYWTIAQMLAHHTSTGCNVRPGDLMGSGTVSGPGSEAGGCLLERTWRGENPIDLPDGTQRKFLQDGDEVIMTAFCEGHEATRIGFGECRGVVMPALP